MINQALTRVKYCDCQRMVRGKDSELHRGTKGRGENEEFRGQELQIHLHLKIYFSLNCSSCRL